MIVNTKIIQQCLVLKLSFSFSLVTNIVGTAVDYSLYVSLIVQSRQ